MDATEMTTEQVLKHHDAQASANVSVLCGLYADLDAKIAAFGDIDLDDPRISEFVALQAARSALSDTISRMRNEAADARVRLIEYQIAAGDTGAAVYLDGVN